jgi:hypothetical protein
VKRISPIVLVTLAALAACSSSSSPSSSDTNADSGLPPPKDPNVASTSIGPIDVAAGQEETVCIYKRLDNDNDIMATSFIADLAPGSHHLIVYRSSVTTEDLDPTACVPFLGLTDQSEVPFLLVGKPHFEQTFPANVGILLPAHQMVKIEAHYINTGSTQIEGQGSVEIHGMPASQATGYQAADWGFWGTKNFDIPPKSSATTGVLFEKGVAGTTAFAISSHQHELGTRVQAWTSHGASQSDAGPDAGATIDQGTQVLDNKDWSNPAFPALEPPIAFDGTNGFAYQCDWNNTTDQDVQFGESALNEMCFIGFYYYPSQGFDLCLDGRCRIHR